MQVGSVFTKFFVIAKNIFTKPAIDQKYFFAITKNFLKTDPTCIHVIFGFRKKISILENHTDASWVSFHEIFCNRKKYFWSIVSFVNFFCDCKKIRETDPTCIRAIFQNRDFFFEI